VRESEPHSSSSESSLSPGMPLLASTQACAAFKSSAVVENEETQIRGMWGWVEFRGRRCRPQPSSTSECRTAGACLHAGRHGPQNMPAPQQLRAPHSSHITMPHLEIADHIDMLQTAQSGDLTHDASIGAWQQGTAGVREDRQEHAKHELRKGEPGAVVKAKQAPQQPHSKHLANKQGACPTVRHRRSGMATQAAHLLSVHPEGSSSRHTAAHPSC